MSTAVLAPARPQSAEAVDGRSRRVARDAPLHLVLNGAAGNRDDAAVEAAVQQVLGGAGRTFVWHRAATPAALAETARTAAAQAGSNGVVVAVGGDGTINTVAGTLLGSRVALGLVPRGTFNYTARSHDIPLEPEDALRLLLDGRAQAVQVGRVNDRPFLVNASVGMYPELMQDREAFKRRYGRTRLNALWAALKSVMHEHPRLALRIEADGQAPREIRISTLFVGNNALQLRDLGLPEADEAGRSALAALVLRAFKPGELLWLALRGAFGALGDADDLTHFAFHELTVQPRRRLARSPTIKVAIDGEITRLPQPLRFAVDERPLWLIRPAPRRGDADDAGTAG